MFKNPLLSKLVLSNSCISTIEVAFRNHDLMKDSCLYLVAGVFGIELLIDKMFKHISNLPMRF